MAAIGFPIEREIQNPKTARTNESSKNVNDITVLTGGINGAGSLRIIKRQKCTFQSNTLNVSTNLNTTLDILKQIDYPVGI